MLELWVKDLGLRVNSSCFGFLCTGPLLKAAFNILCHFRYESPIKNMN